MAMHFARNMRLLMVAAFLSLGAFAPLEEAPSAAERDSGGFKNLREVMSIAEKNYFENISEKQLTERAIKGMVQSLDNSSYFTKEEFERFEQENKSAFGGLGVEIALKDGFPTIVAPIEGTPGEKAGLKAGDRIVRIDNEPTNNFTLLDAVRKIRGPTGTNVTLSIMRGEFSTPKDFSLTRATIHVASVKSQVLEEGYPYLRVTTFREGTHADLVRALKDLGEESRVKGVILDLRNNPGGLLDQAVKIAGLFVEEGLITFTEGRAKGASQRFMSDKKEKHYRFKIAVLINQGTSSGSEIIAAALQDHDLALVFGTKSFGMASVRTMTKLSDGSGVVLTTARFYSPKGREIHGAGVQPDVDLKKEIEEAGRVEPKGETSTSKGKVDLATDIVTSKALDWLRSETTVRQHKAAHQ